LDDIVAGVLEDGGSVRLSQPDAPAGLLAAPGRDRLARPRPSAPWVQA
jgi:hypothetical protein